MPVKVTLDLAAIDRLARGAAERGVQFTLARGESILRGDILSRPGSGRLYGKHRASAPGEPPAVDKGELRNKTQADPQLRYTESHVIGRIVANVEKASALERGTERMAARPFLSVLRTQYTAELAQAFKTGAKS